MSIFYFFFCEYCRSTFSLLDLKKNKEKNNKTDILTKEFDKLQDMEGYHCNNCGAEIVTNNSTASTKCIYCKSNAIIKNRLTGIYKPESIILFNQTKDDAIKAFKKLCKGRLLIPHDFNNINNIQEMEGLYVPFWLYSCENECYLKANCTKVRTWISGNYRYAKTSHYLVQRAAKLSFQNIPNDGAKRFDNKIMNAIEPFDYNKLKSFETSYLAGFSSEKYDVFSTDAYKYAKQRIEEDSKNYLKNKINGYESVLIKENTNQINVNEIKYVFLPVWVLNIKYKDKIYHFAMNGESGKMIGEIPVSTSKLLLTIIISFILSSIIIIIMFKILRYRW